MGGNEVKGNASLGAMDGNIVLTRPLSGVNTHTAISNAVQWDSLAFDGNTVSSVQSDGNIRLIADSSLNFKTDATSVVATESVMLANISLGEHTAGSATIGTHSLDSGASINLQLTAGVSNDKVMFTKVRSPKLPMAPADTATDSMIVQGNSISSLSTNLVLAPGTDHRVMTDAAFKVDALAFDGSMHLISSTDNSSNISILPNGDGNVRFTHAHMDNVVIRSNVISSDGSNSNLNLMPSGDGTPYSTRKLMTSNAHLSSLAFSGDTITPTTDTDITLTPGGPGVGVVHNQRMIVHERLQIDNVVLDGNSIV